MRKPCHPCPGRSVLAQQLTLVCPALLGRRGLDELSPLSGNASHRCGLVGPTWHKTLNTDLDKIVSRLITPAAWSRMLERLDWKR